MSVESFLQNLRCIFSCICVIIIIFEKKYLVIWNLEYIWKRHYMTMFCTRNNILKHRVKFCILGVKCHVNCPIYKGVFPLLVLECRVSSIMFQFTFYFRKSRVGHTWNDLIRSIRECCLLLSVSGN